VEERGVALYALGRHADALAALERLTFPTHRSRLYRAASLVALERVEDARKLCDEAVAANPNLNLAGFLDKEPFRAIVLRETLGSRLAKAGLPA
jgi:adenylate cyclase